MRKSHQATRRSTAPTRPAGFVLGRAGFARISAVEGIVLTAAMQETMEGFDRAGLSAEERRARIVSQFRPPVP
jgi:hypothetical protein